MIWSTVTVVAYIVIILIAAYVRFYTEVGFWQAVHTGRTFMLQAATLSVGVGVAHFDQVARSNTLRPLIPLPHTKEVTDALTPQLLKTLGEPAAIIFIIGVFFILLYILTGFPEGEFLREVGNPPHPKKYISSITQETTARYNLFIGLCLWLGMMCLLTAWYFLVDREGRGMKWYMWWAVTPAHIALALLLTIGPKISRTIRGTVGKPQNWDVEAIQKREE